MDKSEKTPINFFDHLNTVAELFRNKTPIIFLDYDGTLTPIVATPDLAVISDDMRETVRRLAQRYKVSIVSGRATDDVRSKVRIDGIFYAGSHGFEIRQPDGQTEINQEARAIRSEIDEVHKKLSGRVKNIQGALIENVKYTISAHYRLVSEKDFPKIEAAVDGVLTEHPNLRKTHGKKVFEIRPRIDWHKGKAVHWILKVLDYSPQSHVPVYIGDDTTDEDAFREIKKYGLGILVAEVPRPSEAKYMIGNAGEVQKVLNVFIDSAES